MEPSRNLGKTIAIVLGINLVMVLIYTLVFGAMIPGNHRDSLGFAIAMAFTVSLHAFLCVVAGVVFWIRDVKGFVGPFILAALAVALIGFSACFGGATYMTGGF